VVNYTNNTPTSFYGLVESLFYRGHVKGWVKPEKVHIHAVLGALQFLFAGSTYRAMTLVLNHLTNSHFKCFVYLTI
jgi:hypothetical protein